MDFGVLGLDGSEGGLSHLVSEAEARQRGFGSGFLKQGRSGVVEDEWMGLKMARNDDGGVSKPMLVQSKGPLLRSNSLFSDGGQQQLLLSFSSPKSDGGLVSSEGLVERSYQNGSLGCYNTSSIYARNAGLASGGMHGVLAGVRGPFTPSQWMELEHQALIYKYLNANVPIPSNLLIPIRKSLNPSGFSGFSAGSFRPNTWGWGSFHLGFSGNTDPEPGRCRRTDGKKWRCSRDAVADQKYCERHMNRGRHRSRKPVEGQIGHASSGMAAATKAMAIASSAASAASISCPDNSDALAHQQTKSLQPGADPSVTPMSRILMNKSNVDDRIQDSQTLSMLSSVPLKSKEAQFTIPKEHLAFEEEYSKMESGLVSSNSLSSNSLLNMQRSSYVESGNFYTSHDLNGREPQSHPFRHFIDDWPKSRSDHSAITWPEVDEVRSDRTQLSISIPVTSSDFSSSTSSPTQEKLTLSPLKLSREFDPVQMGLGVGGTLNDAAQRQASWIPISWETSMGGPLGEALNNSNNTPTDRKYSASALNLMTEGWDTSPRLRSSPTGVLQKTTFTSISNSSSGSSPRAENNKACDHTSLCDNLYGSAFVNSTIPLL